MVMSLFMGQNLSAQITVGSGNTTNTVGPWSSCYGYSYFQQLYLKPSINSAGTITSLSFKTAGTLPTTATGATPNTPQGANTAFKVYLGHTTKTTFASTTDWVPEASMTLVYDGTLTMPTVSGGLVTITLTTPFAYNNVDNLVIAVDENSPGYACSYSFVANSAQTNMILYQRSDTVNTTAAAPATGTRASVTPQVTLGGLVASTPPNCVATPTSPANAATGVVSNVLTWPVATGSPTGYKISFGTDVAATNIQNDLNVGNVLTYTLPSSLTPETVYYWKVTPYNASGDNTGCTTWSFTSGNIPNCASSLLPADLTSDVSRNPTLSWTAATGSPASYDVYFGNIPSPALVGNQTALTYSPALLDANTTYYWKVVAKNSFGDAVDCLEQSFTTGTSLQYCTAVPTSMDGSGITNVVLGLLSNPNVSTTARYQNFTTGLTVPDLAQSTTMSMGVTYANGVTYETRVFIDFNQDGDFSDASENQLLGTSTTTNPTTLTGTISIPSDALVGNTRMRVIGSDFGVTTACYNGTWANVEDYTVNITLPPSCLPPSALAATSVTGNSATVSWDCVGCTGTFELDYGPAGHTAGTGTIVTGATSGYALSSLSATTAYTVYVRQDCGGGSYSPWSTVNFTTTLDCAAAIVLTADVAVTSGSLATTGGVYNNNACGFGTPGKEALYSFTTTTAGTYILTISNVNGGFGYIDYMYKDASLGCGPTGWTCIDDNSATGTDSMTLLAGTTYYILLDAESASGTANHTFSISQAALVPGCATLDLPADASTDVDSATVTMSWTAPAVTATESAATSYKIYFGTVNPPTVLASSPTTTSYTRTGLAYSTTYYWRVISVNSGGDSVGCTDVYSFTTEADPCIGVVPTGDTFADPIVLGALVNGTPTTSAGDNLATNCWHDDYTTSSTPGNGSARPGRDIFYQFEIADLCNSLTVATCGASFDTYLHILDAAGTRVAFNDDGCGTSSTLTTSTLVPGIYYAVVDGYNATSEGTFTLSLDYTSTPSVTYYADADGDTFGDANGNPIQLCTPTAGFATNNLDCDDTNAAVNPVATEIAYDGIDNNCDGQLDEGFPPLATKVIASQCGSTVAAMNSFVFFTTAPTATQYRVRITNPVTGLSFTIETPNNYFTFKSFSSYDFATTYDVEVEIQKSGVWLGYYGDVCQVSTPAMPELALTGSACGMTISNRFTGVYTPFIQGVTSYKFRVTRNVPGAVAQEYVSNWNGFMFHYIGGFIYGSSYNVEVAVNTPGDSTFSAYGSPCTVNTPAVPSLEGASCGATITGSYQGIYTTNLGSNATGYRFEITSAEAGTVILDTSLNWFYPIAIPGYVPGRTYEIFVAVKNGTEYSEYGESCFINPVAPAPATKFGDKNIASEFKANGFPNPFTNNFTLDITRASEEKVSVMVYDMIGKLLDRVEVNATDNSLELGANYPAGVYNVVVSQGEKVETVRMVKR